MKKNKNNNNKTNKLIIKNIFLNSFFIFLFIFLLITIFISLKIISSKTYINKNINAKTYKKINIIKKYSQNSCNNVINNIKFKELPPSEHNGKKTITTIPNKIVLHWSEDPNFSGNETTYNGLENRKRACAYAVDDKGILQMVKIDFNNKTRTLEQCVGGNIDNSSISIKVSGTEFDLFIDPDNLNLAIPSSNLEKLKNKYYRYRINYNGLKKNIEKYEWDKKQAIFNKSTSNLICLINFLFEKYNLNKESLKGHYELYNGKSDPGFLYIDFVKKMGNF